MRRIFVALAALLVASFASAQYSDQPNDLGQAATGFSFRVGAYWPTDQALRNQEDIFWDAGMEYDFGRSWVRNGMSYVAADWISNDFLGAQHYATLTINQRVYTNNRHLAAGGSPYLFLGVGASWLHMPGASDTGWVVRGGLGSEFRGNYCVEVAGFASPEMKGVNPSGISVSLGYRFSY